MARSLHAVALLAAAALLAVCRSEKDTGTPATASGVDARAATHSDGPLPNHQADGLHDKVILWWRLEQQFLPPATNDSSAFSPGSDVSDCAIAGARIGAAHCREDGGAKCASLLESLQADGFVQLDAPPTLSRGERVAELVILKNTRPALSCMLPLDASCTTLTERLAGMPTTLHAYMVTVDALGAAAGAPATLSAARLGSLHVPAPELNQEHPCRTSRAAARTSPSHSFDAGMQVGILYEGWHGYATDTMNNITASGGLALTVEDVLESRAPGGANYSLFDIIQKYNAVAEADGFYFQEQPARGFYCIYTNRPGQPGDIPNCANVTGVLTEHASQLLAAGVDYVVTDSTNLPTWTTQADVIQVRPLEVLFETWAALRAAGTPTPAIAAWQVLSTGATLWQNILELYNNATFEPLVFRDPISGKKVFFVPDAPPSPPDPALLAAVESNGGRNDVITQSMWAEFDPSLFDNGLWAFFSPCTTPGGEYTTSVVGLGRAATGCGQHLTVNSSLGTALAVSPSYQLSYGSLPFTAAGKYDGLTLKRQFGTLFDVAAEAWRKAAVADSPLASGLPNHLFLSSWNEWISQPQPNPFNSPYAFSMGFPTDPDGNSLWVDSFGSSLSRDLEPSQHYGAQLYDIVASCMRVAQLAQFLERGALRRGGGDAGRPPPHAHASGLFGGTRRRVALQAMRSLFGQDAVSNTSSCAVSGEVCCDFNATVDDYAPIWSLLRDDAGDALFTMFPEEVGNLTCPGCGWVQTCNPYSGPTDFCTSQSALEDGNMALRGPFVLHAAGCGLPLPGGDPILPGRTPLYRCYDGSHHSFTTDAACGGGAAKLEQSLGCMASYPSTNMPRALRKCSSAGTLGMIYGVLDGTCSAGDGDDGVLGWVR